MSLSKERQKQILEALEERDRGYAAHPGEPHLVDFPLYNADSTVYSLSKTVWIGRNCYVVEVFMDGREPEIRRV